MKSDNLASNPFLKKLVRECDKGDILFSQGSEANTVLLILSGTLQLTQKHQGQVSILSTLGPGEFIGEKAILKENTFPRAATAIALTPMTLLELGPSEFLQLEADAPQLFSLLLKKAFKTLISRNDKLEGLNAILKGYEPQARFLHYIHFLAKHGEQTPHGKSFFLDPVFTSHQLNTSLADVQSWTQTLVDLNLLKKQTEGTYTSKDENELLNFDANLLSMPDAA